MALPAGITTCQVTAGTVFDFGGGSDYATKIIATPLANLTWAATGAHVLGPKVPIVTQSEPGVQAVIDLPHVDQPGFLRAGAPYTMWAYRIDVVWLKGNTPVDTKTINALQPVIGQTSIDLDMLTSEAPALPVQGVVPYVTSVNGVTGEVTVGDADPAVIESAVQDYLTANPPAAVPAASETVSGTVELATTAEATAGTDTVRAVTPAGLKAHTDALPTGGVSSWDDLADKPATFPPDTHTHVVADLTDYTPGSGTLDTEATQDVVGAMIAGAGGTYDDTAGTITLPAGGGALTPVTAATTTPAGASVGQLAGYLNVGGSAVTVDGVTVAAGAWVVLYWSGTAWVQASGSAPTAPPAEPDTTPPNPGNLAVTGAGYVGTTRTLTVSGAADDTALAAAPYRFSADGQATWTAWQTAASWTTPALDAGDYTPAVQVRDAAGNLATATGVAFTVTTEAETWGTLHVDTFDTHPASTSLTGLALEQGGLTWQAPWTTPTGLSAITTNTTGGIPGTGSFARLDVGQMSRFELTFDFKPVGFQDTAMFYWNTTAVFRNIANGGVLGYGDGYYVQLKGAGECNVRKLTLAADGYSTTDTLLATIGAPGLLNTVTPVKIEFDTGVVTVWTGGVQRGTHTIDDWAPAATTPFAAIRMDNPGGSTQLFDNFSLRAA